MKKSNAKVKRVTLRVTGKLKDWLEALEKNDINLNAYLKDLLVEDFERAAALSRVKRSKK